MSYIYLKNENATDFSPIETETQSQEGKYVADVNNVTGPWLCSSCGSDSEPKQFGSYYDFRRHLVEVRVASKYKDVHCKTGFTHIIFFSGKVLKSGKNLSSFENDPLVNKNLIFVLNSENKVTLKFVEIFFLIPEK